MNWIYNYLTYERHARLILESAPSPAEVADREGTLATQEEALGAPPSNRKSAPGSRTSPPGAGEDEAEGAGEDARENAAGEEETRTPTEA